MKPVTRMSTMVIRYPKWIVAFFLAISMAAVTMIPQLTQDPSPYLLAKSHPSRLNLELLRDAYTGARDSVIVQIEHPVSIYNPETLNRIRQLTEAFEKMDITTSHDLALIEELAAPLDSGTRNKIHPLIRKGPGEGALEALELLREQMERQGEINEAAARVLRNLDARMMPVIEVTSLANVDNILGDKGQLDVSPVLEEIPATEAGLKALEQRVWNNEMFRKVLVSEDGTNTGIIIELAVADEDTAAQQRIYDRVKHILEQEIPGFERHYIGGFPVVSAATGTTIQKDTQRLFPAVIVLVVLCLALTFRMASGVMVPLLVVVLSLVVTLAVKALFHIPINIISSTLPIFIISIGVADGIHIFSEFRDHLMAGDDKKTAVQKTMSHLTLPVIMTSVTTAGAFWTLSITEIVQMRHFGLFVALGTLVAMAFSLLFIPALLLILPGGKNRGRKGKSGGDRKLNHSLEGVSRFVMRRPRSVVACAAIILILAICGTTLVRVDNNNIGNFPEDTEIVVSTQKLNEDAAGSLTLEILIRSRAPQPEPLKAPHRLQAIARMAAYLDRHPLVGKTLGLPQLIQRINQVLHDGDPAYYRIPWEKEWVNENDAPPSAINGREMISQYLLLYENSGGDTLSDVIDPAYTQARLTVLLTANASSATMALVRDIENYVKQKFPDDLTVAFSGSANVMVAATFEIVRGQIISLLISFILIFTLLILNFRSLAKGVLAMLPLGATILINFGIMGFFRISLDIGTAVISSIVIGIGVDYSIHYLSRLQRNLDRGDDFETAIYHTVRYSGKAIAANAFTVGLGFTALLFSIFTPLVTMGWMIMATMFISAAAAIILFPALIRVFSFGFLPKPVTPSVSVPREHLSSAKYPYGKIEKKGARS